MNTPSTDENEQLTNSKKFQNKQKLKYVNNVLQKI